MAQYALIDGYLATLRARLRWHREVEDLVAEARDHLYSSVERLAPDESELEVAQRRTLEEFGEPGLMAEAFAKTPRGGLAMPTKQTTGAGNLAIVAAVLWLVVVGAWWVAGAIPPWGEIDRNASAVFWVVGWAALIGACALMVAVMRALNERHGGLGAPGLAGLVLAVVSSVASIAGWVYGGWALPLMAGTFAVAIAMLQRGVAPRIPTLAFGSGLALGGLTWIVSRLLAGAAAEWDGVGFWSESWVANAVGLTVGASVLAFGLAGLGRWLRAEEPADLGVADDALSA